MRARPTSQRCSVHGDAVSRHQSRLRNAPQRVRRVSVRKHVMFAAVTLVCFASISSGLVATGSLSGIVYQEIDPNSMKDSFERTVPDAVVRISSGSWNFSVLSDMSGQFNFDRIEVGTYDLTIDVPPLYSGAIATVGTGGGVSSGSGAIANVNITANHR